jgi:lysophospholipase L1-like esterase
MGDSITFGQHIDPTLRWTALIENRWRQVHDDEPAIRFFNRGVSGETTRMGLERFPRDVQDLTPTVMTLQFGMNDCNCWETDGGVPRVSPAAFTANLVEMIDRARLFGAKEIVLATNPKSLRRTALLSGELYDEANRHYSELVRGVAIETSVTLCDIRAAFARFSDDELRTLVLPAPDLLHLSPSGNALYADTIWPYLQAAITQAIQGREPSTTSIR